MTGRTAPGTNLRDRSHATLLVVMMLGAAGCSTQPASLGTSEPVETSATARTEDASGGSVQQPTEEAFPIPADWEERALASAESARRAVVAIGWDPPSIVNRRLETGWLLASDLVVTSNSVACDARRGSDLQVRTFDGAVRDAHVEEIVNGCGTNAPGAALVRLATPVDAPTLTLRTKGPLAVGEPLMAIGHANYAAQLGGWLVTVGPVVIAGDEAVWADIGMSVDWRRIDEFFGGGANGAPLIDLDGEVAGLLCCERDWAPPVALDGPLAEPRLRTNLMIDAPVYIGGLSAASLDLLLGEFLGS